MANFVSQSQRTNLILILEQCLLAKDITLINTLNSINGTLDIQNVIQLVTYLLQGEYMKVLDYFEISIISHNQLLTKCNQSMHKDIHKLIFDYIFKIEEDNSNCKQCKIFECLILGIAYLELFCQSNYTGPELISSVILKLNGNSSLIETNAITNNIHELECDGTYAFNIVEIPQTLLFARIILQALADPIRSNWKDGIILDTHGNILKSIRKEIIDIDDVLMPELNQFKSLQWWDARSTVIHLRLLQKQSYDTIPTLWKESEDMFSNVLCNYCNVNNEINITRYAILKDDFKDSNIANEYDPCNSKSIYHDLPEIGTYINNNNDNNTLVEESLYSQWYAMQQQLATQAWLEWGLCCHYFSYGDKGRKCYLKAKSVAELVTKLDASLGRRTKHQHTDYAQLFLYAKSTLVNKRYSNSGNNIQSKQSIDISDKPIVMAKELQVGQDNDSHEPNPDGWQHSEWELGRRLVREGDNGEEVAVREVMLDSMDGGAIENIILEGGPRFTEQADKGGDLHAIDQAVILALCLDVSNSNPIDGLTNEEMQPYIERVLDTAKNWMIHSTALLERSWLEFERRKTMDRAMLQIQALIDQHTTKLTIMQSTYKCIEDSAPVQDRLQFLYSIVYPAQYELKRDLAIRYLRCQVFVSALNYFRELEMWDEVVACYQLMSKPQRAEMVVREQLVKTGETPYMLTSLADLTQKEEYYEKAWILSKGRFPRAKRTLGKLCYDRGDYKECIEHLDQALAVHPLVATAWYLKGIACMRLEQWDIAIEAFVRCVQQDMEIGEAWANIGAIYMRQRSWVKAHNALTEALRHKYDNWKIVENLMSVCLAMGKWKEVILHMNKLVDMRLKSERPVHIDELRHLAYIISNQAQRELKLKNTKDSISNELTEDELILMNKLKILFIDLNDYENDDTLDLFEVIDSSDLVLSTEKLLIKITNSIKSESEIWDVYASFLHTLGKFRLELECRIKQYRSVTLDAGWEKYPEKIDKVISTAAILLKSHYFKTVAKTDIYACKMLFQSSLRKIEQNQLDSVNAINLFTDIITRLTTVYEEL